MNCHGGAAAAPAAAVRCAAGAYPLTRRRHRRPTAHVLCFPRCCRCSWSLPLRLSLMTRAAGGGYPTRFYRRVPKRRPRPLVARGSLVECKSPPVGNTRLQDACASGGGSPSRSPFLVLCGMASWLWHWHGAVGSAACSRWCVTSRVASIPRRCRRPPGGPRGPARRAGRLHTEHERRPHPFGAARIAGYFRRWDGEGRRRTVARGAQRETLAAGSTLSVPSRWSCLSSAPPPHLPRSRMQPRAADRSLPIHWVANLVTSHVPMQRTSL